MNEVKQQAQRILARELAHEITAEELAMVSGGSGFESRNTRYISQSNIRPNGEAMSDMHPDNYE
ncbi:hypothetical protein ACO0LF_13810 [Undibacterium sp. Di27W]|uniref:hypothetical protein n=1 Tax=Undibacterium sp. Di27W TaxID=3413036 RepID=UPI003BEF6E54